METAGKKALVIANPTAGKKSVQANMFAIVQELCSNNYDPTVLITAAGGDATRFAREKAKDYDIVITCGGDGTLNETITGLLEANVRVPIGYIPCGTTNDMASSLKLPKTIKRAIKNAMEGEPCYHDIGKFGDNTYFSYIASFGAFTKVSYSTPQATKNMLGHFAYVLEGAKELGNIRSYHVKFSFDDQIIEDDFLFASISNTTSFGGVLSFRGDEVKLNDGMFELLLIKNPKNPIELSNILLNLSKGDFTSDKNMLLYHTNNIKIETEEPIVWTIDGECSGEVFDVNVETIPETIQIILPRD